MTCGCRTGRIGPPTSTTRPPTRFRGRISHDAGLSRIAVLNSRTGAGFDPLSRSSRSLSGGPQRELTNQHAFASRSLVISSYPESPHPHYFPATGYHRPTLLFTPGDVAVLQ